MNKLLANRKILKELSELDKESFNHEKYHKLWENLGPLEIKMVEKNEKCKHNLHDTFTYQTPYDKPKDVCPALLHVMDLYVWRVALNFPSWEEDDCYVHRIHCPDKKGTVWELHKL